MLIPTSPEVARITLTFLQGPATEIRRDQLVHSAVQDAADHLVEMLQRMYSFKLDSVQITLR